MKKIVNKNNISSWLLCMISFIVTVVAMNYVPDKIPVHFGKNGVADCYGNRAVLFLIPVIMFVIIILAEVKKEPGNSAKIGNRYYYQIVFAVNAIITAFELYTIGTACDMELTNIGTFVLVILGLFVMVFGNMMPKFRHNSGIGIRTKWTLQDENIWYSTHRLCAKLWFAGGACLVATAFVTETIRVAGIIVIVAVMILVPVLYSKIEYGKK